MKDHLVDYSIGNALQKAWKWKFWVIGACIVSGAVTMFFAFKMPNEYRSQAAFVPPAIGSLSSMVYNNGIGYRGFESAGEIDVDRTVAYLRNLQLVDSVEKKFNLFEHYKIDKTLKEAYKMFYFLYSKNVNIQYTSQSTIEIECFDTDPQTASDIANTYLGFAADFFEGISERKRGFEATKAELEKMRAERDNIIDTLSYLRTTLGIYHLDNMGDNVDRYLAGKMMASPTFHAQYDKMVSYEVNLKLTEERISDIEREYISRKLNIDQYPMLIQVVEKGQPSTFKARPKRSLYLLASVAATFVFSLFVVLLIDRGRKVKNEK